MSIRTLLDKIRTDATSTSDQGTQFERLMRLFFLNDPLYKDQFTDVWLWKDFPQRDNQPDTGIDIVAKNRDSEGYAAIQCKCFKEDTVISCEHIDSFIGRSSKKQYTRRIFVSTTSKWGKNAEDAIKGLNPAVEIIGMDDLEKSPIDWTNFDFKKVQFKKKELYPYQKTAIQQVQEGFKTADRGKLIMACGTGKTLTSLKIAEEYAGAGGLVLFLVPSLALLSQTLREWTADSEIPLHCYAVCSDAEIGKRSKNDDTVSIKPSDLALPPTTKGETLAKDYKRGARDVGREASMTVVFSTYHSIDVLNEAQKDYGFPEFDLIICDEAHRTTGAKVDKDKDESHFVKVHDADFLKGKKRLYMTATPRLYGETAKKKAAEEEIQIWSMDDTSMYGEEFYRIGFSEAVNLGRLSDYEVIVLAIDEANVTNSIRDMLVEYEKELKSENEGKKKGSLTIDDAQKYAVKTVGCWNGLAGKVAGDEKKKLPSMKRAVAFTNTIAQSKWFTDKFLETITGFRKPQPEDKATFQCETEHVDGSMTMPKRNDLLGWLKSEKIKKNQCRILSNAKCLSEGVDVPALDAVIFLEPRQSKVDIVQSVGRVMRKAKGKETGYIILPILVPPGEIAEEILDNNERFKIIWDVLQAMRAHEDRLDVIVNKFTVVGVTIDDASDGSVTKPGEEPPDLKDTQAAVTQYLFSFPVEELKDALYAKIVKKCGDRKTLIQWAKDVADIATRHIAQIKEIIKFPVYQESFNKFRDSLRQDLNPDITDDEVIDMLSQRIDYRAGIQCVVRRLCIRQGKSGFAVAQCDDRHIEKGRLRY